MVGLAAEVKICKEICRRTKGQYGVILNEDHFKELLFESISPPPIPRSSNTAMNPANNLHQKTNTSSLIQMGFPNKISNEHQGGLELSMHSFCACHSKLRSTGFICPRCGSKNCEIPTNCSVCGLTIVSSPHLARSYRHLFPVGNWTEKKLERHASSVRNQEPLRCFGCEKELEEVKPKGQPDIHQPPKDSHRLNHDVVYECPRCNARFCLECDVYHEQLGLCPGCCWSTLTRRLWPDRVWNLTVLRKYLVILTWSFFPLLLSPVLDLDARDRDPVLQTKPQCHLTADNSHRTLMTSHICEPSSEIRAMYSYI